MSSIVSASVRSSSWGPVAPIRRDRSLAEISRAVAVIAPMGRSTRPETHHPTPRLIMKSTASEIPE